MVSEAYKRLDLSNRVILVTGGGSGIGAETCKLLAARGASVMVADINDSGHATVDTIKMAGGRAAFCRADVSQEDDVKALVEETVKTLGGLNGAFNNAGIAPSGKPLADVDLSDFCRVVDVNLTGVFLCMKYQINYMEPNGGGSIVNCASAVGLAGAALLSGYVASKHGVVGLTRAGLADYATKGIRINAVAPGAIDTPLQVSVSEDPDLKKIVLDAQPTGDWGQPQDVAEAAAWLLSDAASFANGSIMSVDGGFTAV